MNPTKVSNLVLTLGATTVIGFYTLQQLESNGVSASNTSLSLVITQPILAAVLFTIAMPVIRYRSELKKFVENKGKRPLPVDSKYAIRTLSLAKSVSFVGSLLGGLHLALIAFRFYTVAGEGVALSVFGLVGSAILVASGLIVENLFRIPPDSDGETL